MLKPNKDFLVLPFTISIGGMESPVAFTQAMIVILDLSLPVRPTTDLLPRLAMTLTGVCSNCLPVSSQFHIFYGFSCKSRLTTILDRSAKYLSTTQPLSILARTVPSFSGFLNATSGCLFFRPSHQCLDGVKFLKPFTKNSSSMKELFS